MHLTLKQETTNPAEANVLQQQARFDAFVECYNQERPHQALAMKVPADLYRRSPRLESVTYVPGINCYPCARNGPRSTELPRQDANLRPGDEKAIRTQEPPT